MTWSNNAIRAVDGDKFELKVGKVLPVMQSFIAYESISFSQRLVALGQRLK
jgi:hypothetical protein